MKDLDDLRKRGFIVKVSHRRPLVGFGPIMLTRFQRHLMAIANEWEPRGGLTEVTILNADGDVLGAGLALCSDKDQFNRRLGLQIALGRALKDAAAELI